MTRRLVLVLCGALVTMGRAGGLATQRPETEWSPERVTAWVDAVEHHTPGTIDASLLTAAAWTGEDLRALWLDSQVLLELAVDSTRTRFVIPTFSADSTPLPGSRDLRTGGTRPVGSTDRAVTFSASQREALQSLARRVRTRGLNPFLHRAAVLHTDVVTQSEDIATSAGAASTPGRALRWFVGDGTALGSQGLNLHWEVARMLVGRVLPKPAEDLFVRDWYRATVAEGQSREYFDALQLDRGLRLFPADPELLLLAGNQHEAFAMPLFQAFARSIQSDAQAASIGPASSELSEARRLYRRALDARPEFAEARVRLGHVLLLQERHADAARELDLAVQANLDPLDRYVALLFLGAAREQLGQVAVALAVYQRAAAVGGARAPFLAMARLARERGDRDAAMAHLARALAPLSRQDPPDPWWHYRASPGLRRSAWLEDVRRRAADDRP